MATTIHYHSNTITCSHVVVKLDQEVSLKFAQLPGLFYETAAVCALELQCHFLYMCFHYTGEEHRVPVRETREKIVQGMSLSHFTREYC